MTALDAPAANTERRTAGPLAIAVLASAGVTVAIMQTLVVPLVAELPQLLSTSETNASWVVTATLLTAAVTTPVMGRFGDMFGKRRMLLVCVGFVVAGSLIGALSTSLVPMVIARGVQGCGYGLIPLGMSLMRDILPVERLGLAVSLMSASLGVGGSIGLPLSSFIAESLGFNALFWVAGGMAAACGLAIRVIVPESHLRLDERVDYAGVAGLSLALTAYLLAVSKGGDWGWRSMTTLSLFAFAIVVTLAWGWWELHRQEPVVDLRTSAFRPVLLVNLTAFAVGLALYSMNLLAPRMLQLPAETGYGTGLSLVHAGLWMVFPGLTMIALAQPAARLVTIRGAKFALMLGAGLIAVGETATETMLGHIWGVVFFCVSVASGVACAYAAMPTILMRTVPDSQTAAAVGLNTLSRTLGTSSASALIGAVLGQLTVAVGGEVYPSLAGIRVTLGIAAAAALLGVILAFFLPRLDRQAVSV